MGRVVALLFKGFNFDQIGCGMIVSASSPVTKNIDHKGGCVLGERLLRNKLAVLDGALDEMPFSILPFASGIREVDPSLGKLALALVLGVYDAGAWLDVRSMQLRQGRTAFDYAVCELPDFRSIVPSVPVCMDHPGAHAQATVTCGCLRGLGEYIDLENGVGDRSHP